MVRLVVESILHGGLIELFLVPAVLHDWGNKGCGVCYSVCGMVHIKEPLLLTGKGTHVVAKGFLYPYLIGPLPCE